jgi:endonuclease YncB( thermonuclease family)
MGAILAVNRSAVKPFRALGISIRIRENDDAARGTARMRTRLVLVFALALAVFAFPRACVPAVSYSGRATVIDGDSLEVGATETRLYGVDAPEALQTCGEGAASWNCGRAAAEKLRELVGAREITCRQMDTDSYGRSVAVCRNGAVDLGAEMAKAGLALAYRRYSNDYVDEEARARAERRGVWSGKFTEPWNWRRTDTDDGANYTRPTQQRAQPQPPSEGCRIKGNINNEGERIYHVPGSKNFDETVIDESKGERWFCTEAEARRAGWRAPKGQ